MPQEEIDFINHTHAREVEYRTKVALDNKSEDERKRLTDLAPLRVFLAHKERRTYLEYIPSQEDQFTFETISNSIKNFSKSIG